MIDLNVYNELIHRGVITQVGLDPEKFDSIDDLIHAGIVTEISGKDQYNEIVNADTDKTTETPVEPENPDNTTPGGTIETPTEEEGEF
jgi:hypothetical protein